jgi:hypothetical protein
MAIPFGVREGAIYAVLSKLSGTDAEVVEDILDNYF